LHLYFINNAQLCGVMVELFGPSVVRSFNFYVATLGKLLTHTHIRLCHQALARGRRWSAAGTVPADIAESNDSLPSASW